MTRLIPFILFFCLAIAVVHFAAKADIPTSNSGEQNMIRTLRAAIDANKNLKSQKIIIGAGNSGCKAFQKPDEKGGINILMTWQWLDAMKNLANGTIVVMPEHAVDDNFQSIKDKVKLIKIKGVLHTKTFENIQQENADLINKKTDLIVMLAGDTEQQDDSWLLYTPEMANELITTLPQGLNILFLNGPRTGKHKRVDNSILIDKTAHRTTTDVVTQYIIDLATNKPWTIVDFKFGSKSVWNAALKFCLDNPKTILVLPGETTSMISEARSVGIRPAIYKHKAMTKTSEKYVDSLISNHEASLYPELPIGNTLQPPLKAQQDIVITELNQILN
jgi:hypothetical protein